MNTQYLILGGAVLVVLVFGLIWINNSRKERSGEMARPARKPAVAASPRNAGLPPLSRHVMEIASDPSRKISAIKAYREETGLGLKEAKDAVEAWLASGKQSHGQPQLATFSPTQGVGGATPAPALSQHVKDIARDPSRKIAAIKAYRDETGAGLKEAKDAVEAWRASQGLE
jgi:ribosomal protein L7/L12